MASALERAAEIVRARIRGARRRLNPPAPPRRRVEKELSFADVMSRRFPVPEVKPAAVGAGDAEFQQWLGDEGIGHLDERLRGGELYQRFLAERGKAIPPVARSAGGRGLTLEDLVKRSAGKRAGG